MYKIALVIGGRVPEYFTKFRDRFEVYGAPTVPDSIRMAKELESTKQVEAIVAPALMAILLKKHVNIPVIPAENTYFDIVDTLRYAERQSGIVNDKVALVVHASQKIEIEKIQPYISNRLYVYSYSDDKEIAEKIIDVLKVQHFHLAIGGTTTYYLAQQAGMHCFLLRLGRETLLNAVERAEAILEFNRLKNEQNERLKIVLNSVPDGVLMTDQHGRISECNNRTAEIFNSRIENLISHTVDEITGNKLWASKNTFEQHNVLIEINNVKFFATRKPIVVDNMVKGSVAVFQELSQIEKLEHEYRKLNTLGFTSKYQFADIMGDSNVTRKVVEQAKAYARAESTVLIEGETGTGKEIFAQSMHNHSLRKKGPFVAINCAALPENLLESELMGYEEGAFTGAKRGGKPGVFELAHKGTIFLDEINQMPLQLQARILRVLQEKQVMRLGGERLIPVNVRIIAASNEDLAKLISERRFREDLFYRLNVLSLRLPALRDRKQDIPQLLKYFFEIYGKIHGLELSFCQVAQDLLVEYEWPGNIRELINLVERYAIIKKQLLITDLNYVKEYLAQHSKNDYGDNNGISIDVDRLDRMERQLITKVLKKVNGSKSQAATLLGISRTTLWNKMRESE